MPKSISKPYSELVPRKIPRMVSKCPVKGLVRTRRKLRVPAWVAIMLFGGMIVLAVITMS